MAAEHEAAGGVPVEPVRQRRRPRQSEPQRVEMIFQTFAALGAAMHGKPAGLSITSISPSRWSRRATISSGVMVAYLGETANTGTA